MKYISGVATGVLGTVLIGGAGLWVIGAKPHESGKAAPPPIPATIPKPFKEDQATAITLTADAEARLGIKTAAVERKPMQRVRQFGGEVMVPSGRSVIVAAPLAGVLKPVSGINLVAGLKVKAGQPLAHLVPLLDPVGRTNLVASRLDAEGLVLNAAEQLKAANITLDRAKNVLKGGAGRQRDVDDAQAAVDLAQKTLDNATARSKLLRRVLGELDSGSTASIAIESPQSGILRTVSALPGQSVPSGASLFEVIDIDTVWIRVPVYVGDALEMEANASASIGGLTDRAGAAKRLAKPVAAPPAANPLPGTVDLIYELDNRSAGFRPGERVGAALPLKGPTESLCIAWSAVVFDIHGGAWAYERTAPRSYARKRVVVRYVTEGAERMAVLDSGPKPGTNVVTVGAAELFGADAGFSK
ncbi:MAG TPA: efflux RND transporter periplasmic adaptor subunit [Urbifossiella sp.]|nr:efflux RND transporter periplasmic adaptor subunit [Urbifossiella sp.]